MTDDIIERQRILDSLKHIHETYLMVPDNTSRIAKEACMTILNQQQEIERLKQSLECRDSDVAHHLAVTREQQIEIERIMQYNDELQDKLREIRAIVKETLND